MQPQQSYIVVEIQDVIGPPTTGNFFEEITVTDLQNVENLSKIAIGLIPIITFHEKIPE